MASAPISNFAAENDGMATQDSEEQEYILKAGWKTLFGFTTKQHLPVLCGALLGAFFAALTMPILAIIYGLIFQEYTNYGLGTADSSTLMSNVTKYCVILTGVATLNWIANSLYFFFFLTFGELQARSARTRVFETLIKKDIGWFDTRETGVAAFLPRIQMHIRDLQLSVSQPLGEAVQSIMQFFVALAIAFYYSWNLTLVIICTIPLLYFVQTYISNRLTKRAHAQAEKLQSALKYITTAIQSIETVKCFNGERYELQKFTNIVHAAAVLYRRVASLRSMQIGLIQFFTLSVFVQGFWYGTHLVDTGEVNPGEVFTTFWAALTAISGVTSFVPQLIVLQKGKIAGAHLRMLMMQMSTSDQLLESQGQIKPARCLGDIEFKQVTFSYPSRVDEVAIRDASLFIPAGETTFVIGKSGSGKSTLGQLLVRFYQPSSGQIFLDGVPLKDLDVRWLRENVTLVEQHSVLFNDTIRNNLALGKVGGTLNMEDVRDAVKFATLEPVIASLPDNLETHLGIKTSLSGGQKQRLALARARIRNSPVLILDESTSALDYVTRAEILEAIRNWRKGKTTIIITHDISQIHLEDFVYLLGKAQVVQDGYRKDLESRVGAFQAFLDSHEELEDDEETGVDIVPYGEDDADDIASFYDEYHQPTPRRRPLSAVFFDEAVLQPFRRKPTVRESWAGSVFADQDGDAAKDKECEGRELKASPDRPSVPSSAPGSFPTMEYNSRPNSRTSRPLSRSLLNTRPHSFSRNAGSKRSSMVSTRPVSRVGPYPRPLTIYESRPIHFDTPPKKRSKKSKVLTKMGLSRRKSDTEKQGDSNDSLPIMEILKSVWPTITWRSRLLLLGAFLSAIVHAAATPVFAWVFSKLLATFNLTNGETREARNYALSILGIAVSNGVSGYCMFFLADAAAQSWTLALKTEAMRRILMQPREFFDKEENSMARLAETLDHFAEEARNLPGRFACVFFVIIIIVVFSIAWSMAISWKLALVALAMGPILFGITKCFNMVSGHWEELSNEADDKVGEVLHETIVNIRTVRCLVLEDHFRKKYSDATTAAVNVGIKRALYSGSIFGLSFTGVIFVAILLMWWGGSLISKDENTVSDIVSTFLILLLSVDQVSCMASYITQINISRAAGSRLLRLAHLPTNSQELTGTIQIPYAGDIVINNVDFTYPTRQDMQVLQNISFRIPKGSCTAIVGSSGSGKSTIASLLLKLYQTDTKPFWSSEPTGNMTVSNYNIKDLHTTTLRSRMAIVSQTPVLFPGTIAENIAYGLSPSLPAASMDSIRAAAEAAGVDEFIDGLPQAYNTLIGEGGTGLSGGQAQRISIARALVRDPDILILDEATSALDVTSAATIRDTVLELVRKSCTEELCSAEKLDSPPSLSPSKFPRTPPLSPRSRSGGVWDDETGGVELVYGQRQGQYERGKGKAPVPVLVQRPKKQMTVIIITHAREMMAIAEHIVMLDRGKVVEEGGFLELKRKKGGAFGRLLRGER